MKFAKSVFVTLITLTVIVMTSTTAMSANLIHGMRFPQLSPDGSQLVFSYQGDLWSVNALGGEAVRLTAHDAYESRSRFSPDGSMIAFHSFRYGNADIFVMPSNGARQPERITTSSNQELLQCWYPDGEKLLITTNGPMRRYNMASQDLSGGMSIPIFEDLHGHDYAVFSRDGNTIYYLRSGGWLNWWRTGYKGSADYDVWSYNLKTGEHKLIYEDDRNQQFLLMGHDGKYLVFVDYVKQGTSNLARFDIASQKLTYLTNYDDDTVRNPTIDNNGVLVYEYMNDLWRMEPGKSPARITVFASAEDKTNQTELRILNGGASSFSVSNDNKLVAVSVEGDILVYRTDGEVDNEAINLTNTSRLWEDEPVFATDNKTLYYIADTGSGSSLIKHNLENGKAVTLLENEVINNLQRVPKTDLLSFIKGSGEIMIFNPDDKSSEEIAYKICYTCGYVYPLNWSPDGRYLALVENIAWAAEVYIIDRETKEVWNLSNYFEFDNAPVFSPDGRWIAYWTRSDDRTAVQLVELDPKADVAKTVLIEAEKKEESEQEKTGDSEAEKKEEKKEEEFKVTINFDRIDERARIVSSSSGYNLPLGFSRDGEWLFYSRTDYSAVPPVRELWKVPTDPKSKQPPQKFPIAADQLFYTDTSIYALNGGKVYNFTDNGVGAELPFTAKQNRDIKEETGFAFMMMGQNLKESFYDEKMHGADLDKLQKKYAGMLDDARTPEDIAAIMNRLNGDLNASHLGCYGPSSFSGQPDNTASLGLEWDRYYPGPGLKVRRVFKDSTADKPDIEISPGDVVLEIENTAVDIRHDPSPILNHKEGEVVTLTVKGEIENREVKIKAGSAMDDYSGSYNTWVEENRQRVDKLSNGRLGYVHIRQMNNTALARFEKEYYNLIKEKDGVVIDVRFNPGGRIHEELIDILDRRIFGYSSLRGYEEYMPQPYTYNRTPSIMIINEACTSDSEIFPWAYKRLGLGKLVGMETFGCVIGTTWHRLPGGYIMGIPCEGWYRDDKRNLENEGVKPDIVVPWPPDAISQDRDPQLERAVEELLQELS